MALKDKHLKAIQIKHIFYLYIASLTIFSASLFLMPYGLIVEDKTMWLTYAAGALFWVGAIGIIATSVYITRSKIQNQEFCKKHQDYKKLGLVQFFQNTEAFICDIVLFISVIGFVVARIWAGTTVWTFLFLAIATISFGMHCMLNGSNYIYIKYKTRRDNES